MYLIKNDDTELEEIIMMCNEYIKEYKCSFERLLAVEMDILDAEIAAIVSPSDGNVSHLYLLRKVLTRLDKRIKLNEVTKEELC